LSRDLFAFGVAPSEMREMTYREMLFYYDIIDEILAAREKE
jgi:hypothetical protein